MNKVVNVNLNGHPYALEEPAYEALRAYLDEASARLAGDPDRDEIVADLEQAIADKCRRRMGPHKSVIGSAEMGEILAEMGPVEAEPTAAEAGDAGAEAGRREAPKAPRRLYQVREGAMLAGVCNGIAAFFNVDVTLVRLAFVLLIIGTGGFAVLAYLILMFVMPDARTAEERAAARGEPFNAQELVDRAKAHYAALREEGSRWHDDWRRRRRERHARRQALREREFWARERLRYHGGGYGTQVLGGLLVPVLAAISAGMFVALVIASASLLLTGGIGDFHLPDEMPAWVAVLVLVVAHQALSVPLRAASRAAYDDGTGAPQPWLAVADGLLWIGFVVLLFWLAWLFCPEVRDLYYDTWDGWREYVFRL